MLIHLTWHSSFTVTVADEETPSGEAYQRVSIRARALSTGGITRVEHRPYHTQQSGKCSNSFAPLSVYHFLNFHLLISNGILMYKLQDKWNNFPRKLKKTSSKTQELKVKTLHEQTQNSARLPLTHVEVSRIRKTRPSKVIKLQ